VRKYFLAASLALAMNLFSQLRGNLHVTGEVQHDPSAIVNELTVELYDQQQHQIIDRAFVMSDGRFEFRNVAAGNYEVRLVNRYGEGIKSEYVSLNQGTESVIFRIAEDAKKPVSGTVAVSQLEHHVNRKALHEFQLATKALENGNAAGSVPHLEKSIAADPQFAGAHHQLGVALMAQGQPDEARAEFEKAVALDPALAVGHTNLAIVMMSLRRFGDAENEARRAIQLEPNMVKAHFVLALSLLRQQKLGKEALNHLRRAYEEYPQARTIGSKLAAQLAATN
jgi:tetratricopeptide (TPR) repeat protein